MHTSLLLPLTWAAACMDPLDVDRFRALLKQLQPQSHTVFLKLSESMMSTFVIRETAADYWSVCLSLSWLVDPISVDFGKVSRHVRVTLEADILGTSTEHVFFSN